MDLTVAATPAYFATMAAEYLADRRRIERIGPRPADYERKDTLASLSMGVGSLVIPLVTRRLIRRVRPDTTRLGKVVVGAGLTAAAITTAADAVARITEREEAADTRPEWHESRRQRRRRHRLARRAAKIGGPAAIGAGWLSLAAMWGGATEPEALYERRVMPDMGDGPLPLALAVVGWDFVYYWNHRIMHESRILWAIHVVHHSSERYNLSTALRQPVADVLGTFVPHATALIGVRPDLIETARGVNLLYQYWIHTDLIGRLGWFEKWFNTPSHHRVHHGANPEYIDNNYAGILIVWDRLFGSFVPETDEVVYGLTKNIDTFDPIRIATHEYVDIVRDVSEARTWSDRLSFMLRGPGWAYARHAQAQAAADHEPASAAAA